MSRKGSMQMSVVTALPQPPAAPPEFSAPERKVWEQTLRSMRPGYFSDAFAPVLSAYCFEVTCLNEIAAELRTLKRADDPLRYSKLLRQHRDMLKLVGNIAVKLRLTPSSNRPPKASLVPQRPKPWEVDDPA